MQLGGDELISNLISVGDKVDIRLIQNTEHEEKLGSTVRILKSQVEDITEDDIKMAMPIEKGRIVLLSTGLRYEFCFYTKTGLFRCEGEVQNRYKSGNIFMVSVVVKSQLERHQRREFYRLACLLDITYKLVKKETDIYNIVESKNEFMNSGDILKGIVLDISGGGLRFICDNKIEIGTYICFMLQIELNNQVRVLSEFGKVISSERIETDQERKYEIRIKYEYLDKKDQEMIIKYVFETERKKVNKKRD